MTRAIVLGNYNVARDKFNNENKSDLEACSHFILLFL